MNLIQPCEILNLYNSIISVREILNLDNSLFTFNIDEKTKKITELNLSNNKNKINQLNELINYLEKVFDFDKMINLNKNDINESFFNSEFSEKKLTIYKKR